MAGSTVSREIAGFVVVAILIAPRRRLLHGRQGRQHRIEFVSHLLETIEQRPRVLFPEQVVEEGFGEERRLRVLVQLTLRHSPFDRGIRVVFPRELDRPVLRLPVFHVAQHLSEGSQLRAEGGHRDSCGGVLIVAPVARRAASRRSISVSTESCCSSCNKSSSSHVLSFPHCCSRCSI